MARSRGEGTLFKRKSDGLWVGRISLGYGPDGKRITRQVTAKTQGAARERLAALREDSAGGYAHGRAVPTVEEHVKAWLARGRDKKGRPWSPATRHGYEAISAKYLIPHLGRKRLDKITVEDVQAMLDVIAEKRATGTVRNVRECLSAALWYAKRMKKVKENVAREAIVPEVERRKVDPLSLEDAKRFLAAVEDHHLAPLFKLVTATGLRQSEALALQWDDVDLDGGLLHVRRRVYYVDGQYHTGAPKTERSARTIPLPATIVSMLREHREAQRKALLRDVEDAGRPPRRWEDHGLVFPNETGGPLYGPHVTRTLQRLLAEMNEARAKQLGRPLKPEETLPALRFHDLRHGAASILLALGVPLKVVSETLGHSSIRVTADVYGHVLPELQRESAAKMDSWLAAGQ